MARQRKPVTPPAGEGCARWPADFDPVTGCWRWQGSKHPDGYGLVAGGRPAHRAVYEEEVGPIPEGHELDHSCRRRDCVAPAHLEPVRHRDNERRKRWAWQARRQRCPAGHDLYTRGRQTPEGGKICRTCSGV